jgi:catalase
VQWFAFANENPESIHAMTMMCSDHGTPDGWLGISAHAVHAFAWINDKGERTYVKYHWEPEHGTKYLDRLTATRLCGEDPDYSKRQLYNHIAQGNDARWVLSVQVMTPEQANSTRFDPFDATKVWPKKEYPLQKVGVQVLNRNPENYFRDVEQAAFNPGALIPGIELSPDPLLAWRSILYQDAQMNRLGVNMHQIPVNCREFGVFGWTIPC